METKKRADAVDIRSKAHRRRKMATRKRADADDIRSRARRWRKMATIKRADAKAIQITGTQRVMKGDNKKSGCIGYTNQGPLEGGEGRQ